MARYTGRGAAVVDGSRASVAGSVVTPEGRVEACDQAWSVERLGQKADGSGLHRSREGALLWKGRDEDERHVPAAESKWVCSSTPLMDGMRTSEITHDMPSRRSDFRNSSADANVKTVYPCDLTRLLVDARTDASSSIIAIMGIFFGNESSFGEPVPGTPPYRSM